MNSNWSYSPETPNLGQSRRFFWPCVLAIWRMTVKNNRAPLLCCFKLCASFHNHWYIQTGVTVQKRPIWVKIDYFFSRVPSKFDLWPWKNNRELFYATSSFAHHFIAIGEFKLDWVTVWKRPIWVKFDDFLAVRPWNLMDDLEKQ